MLKPTKPKGQTHTDRSNAVATAPVIQAAYAVAMLCACLAQADTVYRCGEAYSATHQCATAVATEIKPESGQHATGANKSNLASHELREAQTLERQRLQAERQAAQTTPMRLQSLSAPAAPPALTQPVPHGGRNKYARKSPSPYFTAVDPNATHQKKSTAQAVPAKND